MKTNHINAIFAVLLITFSNLAYAGCTTDSWGVTTCYEDSLFGNSGLFETIPQQPRYYQDQGSPFFVAPFSDGNRMCMQTIHGVMCDN